MKIIKIKVKIMRLSLDVRSKIGRIEKTFGPDFLTYMLKGEPQTYKEVVNSTEGLMWKEVIHCEIDSIL